MIGKIEGYIAECDGCGETLGTFKKKDELMKCLSEENWYRKVDSIEVCCSDCFQEKYAKENIESEVRK